MIENLKIVRKKQKLTQKDLAEMLNCKQQDISRYETKPDEPSIDRLKQLSNILQTSVDYLIANKNDISIPEILIENKPLSSKERQVIIKFRKLSLENQKSLRNIIDNLSDS